MLTMASYACNRHHGRHMQAAWTNLLQEKMIDLCEKVFNSRVGVTMKHEDIAHVELKSVSSAQSVFTKSIFVRFNELDLRFVKSRD